MLAALVCGVVQVSIGAGRRLARRSSFLYSRKKPSRINRRTGRSPLVWGSWRLEKSSYTDSSHRAVIVRRAGTSGGSLANSPGFRPHPGPRGCPVPWQASQTPGETNGFAPAEVRRSAPQVELELPETLLQVGVWILGETSGVTGRARILHTRIVDQNLREPPDVEA